jgi:uncharacterized membrane protein YqjE
MMIDKILENVLRYIESRFELFKLEIEESVSTAMVKLIQGLVVGILGTLVVIFLSIGLVNVLNMWLKSTFAGYFIVSGIYLLLMLGIVSKAGERKLREKIEAGVGQMFEKRKTMPPDEMTQKETPETTTSL